MDKAIKKKEILPFATAQMDLEDVMLSEISQTQKYHMTSLVRGILKKKKKKKRYKGTYKTERDSQT